MTTPPLAHIGDTSQVVNVQTASLTDGRGSGVRVLRCDVHDGVSIEVVPDRALDIVGAWWGGRNLVWRSPVGIVPPHATPGELSWLDTFPGGLVSTCGIDNVGAPSDGLPLHGTIGQRKAADVRVAVEQLEDGPACVVRGHVDDVTSMGRHLRLERTITSHAGTGLLRVDDTVANLGSTEEPAPLLYHINLGWPVWAPGSTVSTGAKWVEPVEGFDGDVEDWGTAPDPIEGGEQSVFEHIAYPGTTLSATVTSPSAGIEISLTWSTDTLDRFTQWVHPAAGMNALGLEPTNASVLGRERDRADGRLRTLAPGSDYSTWLEFRVEPLN